MSNKYIDAICSENYGAVDSARSLIARAKESGLPNVYSLYQNLI